MRLQYLLRGIVRGVSAAVAGCGLAILVVTFAAALGASIGQVAERQFPAQHAGGDDAGNDAYSAVLYETDFLRDLRSGSYFRRQKASTVIQPREDETAGQRAVDRSGSAGSRSWAGETYRTLCVRLCDGYYFPISTSTTRDRFSQDSAACRSRCGTAARLYVYKTRDGGTDSMVDLNGRRYASLGPAFLYRAKYDQSCKCRPHPWEPEAVRLHQVYASKAWQVKAKRLARLEEKRWKASRSRARLAAFQAARVSGQADRYSRSVDNPFLPAGVAVRSAPAPLVAEAGGNNAGNDRAAAGGAAAPVVGQEQFRQRYRAMGLGAQPAVRARVRPAPRSSGNRGQRSWKRQVFGGSES